MKRARTPWRHAKVGMGLLCLFPLCAWVSACVTGKSPAGQARGMDGRVVERSREAQPDWTDLESGRLHQSAGGWRFVDMRTRWRDLPLGLNQAQIGALESSRQALGDHLQDVVTEVRDAIPEPSRAELKRHIDQLTLEIHGKHAKVGDIYFEKLEATSGDAFYNTFILVVFPNERMFELLSTLGRRLSASKDGALRQIGAELSARAKAGGLSH